ncbi:MAG: hypothetical protein GY858_00980 [Candidatus Omnitrophica bacterium]|nr:hypothetical protein [Candidatus Omnitrophota bacterium]
MKKSLTLIEVLMACAIFAVVAVSLYSLLSGTIFTHKRMAKCNHQNVYRNLEIVAGDLRNGVCFGGDDLVFDGNSRQCRFKSLAKNYKTGHLQILDISYNFYNNALFKNVKKSGDSSKTEFISDIENMELTYFNGESNTWHESCQSEDGFPSAVRLKITGRNEENWEKYICVRPQY